MGIAVPRRARFFSKNKPDTRYFGLCQEVHHLQFPGFGAFSKMETVHSWTANGTCYTFWFVTGVAEKFIYWPLTLFPFSVAWRGCWGSAQSYVRGDSLLYWSLLAGEWSCVLLVQGQTEALYVIRGLYWAVGCRVGGVPQTIMLHNCEKPNCHGSICQKNLSCLSSNSHSVRWHKWKEVWILDVLSVYTNFYRLLADMAFAVPCRLATCCVQVLILQGNHLFRIMFGSVIHFCQPVKRCKWTCQLISEKFL